MWNHLVVSSPILSEDVVSSTCPTDGCQHDVNCGRSVEVAEKETRSDEDTTQEKEPRTDVTNNITTSLSADGPRMPFISDQEYASTVQRLSQVPHTAYQVDYAAVNCGMVISATKRVIRFKFGFTNQQALSSGKKGTECQGNEHEVIVTWSLNSGKRAVAFDKHEVLFTIDEETKGKFSHSWRDEEGHAYYLIAHAVNISLRTDTLLIPNPDWKQYDLFVDGVSFFRMPKLLEVGIGLKLPRDKLPSVTPHPEQHDGDSEGAMSDLSDH